VGRALDVAVLDLVAGVVGQHLEVEGGFEQLPLLSPVDHRLEVDARRIGVEHGVLRERGGLADPVHAAHPELQGTVGHELAVRQAHAWLHLHGLVVVDLPVVPRERDVLA